MGVERLQVRIGGLLGLFFDRNMLTFAIMMVIVVQMI